jgi:glucose-1-phosphate thymidylyltransferase
VTNRPKGLILAGTRPGGVPPEEMLDAALLPVANKPLIVYALETLHEAGVREAALVADGALAPAVREALDGHQHGLRVRFIAGESTGVVGALRAAESFLDGRPCLLHTLDGLLTPDSDLSAQLDGSGEVVFVAHTAGGPERSVLGLSERRLLNLCDPQPERGAALAGVALFGPGLVSRAAVTRSGALDLAGVVESAVGDGGRCSALTSDASWLPVTNRDELLEANRRVLDGLGPAPETPVPEGVDVQGRAWIHPSATLEQTVIRGPAIIGAGAELRHAYIGPYTSVGEHVTVEGAEVEHSILLARADIRHLGRRLEASVVGRQARVFRDFALPRALRLRVADGDEISLA